MSVHKPGGPAPAAALLSLVALTLPLTASAQAPATALLDRNGRLPGPDQPDGDSRLVPVLERQRG
jgi:hypothetical protein